MSRDQWDNSPELRDAVISDMRNWAAASHGGWPHLGYPDHAAFAVEPSPSPPPFDLARAEKTEKALLQTQARGPESERIVRALMLHFMSSQAAHSKAKALKVSRATFYRMVDEGLYRIYIQGLTLV